MINITEQKTHKLPGETSLFISFDYNPEIVSLIKTCDTRDFNDKTKIWEVPVNNLSRLLNELNKYDDITLNIIPQDEQIINQRKIKTEFKTHPYQYQLEGITYGLNHDKWLLLDKPGLGKTLQMIYLAQELKAQDKINHCLIICGVNTLKTNWKNEIKKHSDLSCKILGERLTKTGKIKIGSVSDRLEDLKNPIDEFFVITNIETLRNDNIIKELKKGKTNKFDMIVVDEIHTCKSKKSQQGANLLKLSAKYMIGLTGTLITNSPIDCYVPLTWIGANKSDLTHFKYYFYAYGGQFGNEIIGYKNLDVLKSQIDNHSLRRGDELLDLPEKTIINEFVDMNDSQEIFYNNIKEGIINQVDKVKITPTNLLAMLSRLRQATACPSYLTTENIISSKLERAKELAEEIISNGNKVLIFSVFKESLNILNEQLKEYNPLLCTGDVKDNQIEENKELFQTNNNYKIMLATAQKMGTGVTLTAATYAIFIDCPWTYADCEQSEKRIHRIGSDKPVFIYYLWCNNTVDLKVKEIVETKELIGDWVIDDTCPPQLFNKLKEIITDLQ